MQTQTNKTVLITGASSGIGKALAIQYAKNGYNICLMARNSQNLKQTSLACKSIGAFTTSFIGDVSIQSDCEAFVNQSINTFGSIHVLICNAGISMRSIFVQTELTVIEKLMNTNFWGSVYCTKFALPHVLKTKGSIIVVSSIAGFKGLPARTGYSASKFALHGFFESLRCENLNNNLHVLIACPGYTESNIRKVALNQNGNQQGETPLDEKALMPAETVAKHIFKAQKQKRNYLILTFTGKFIVFINKHFPKLADKLAYNAIKKETNSPF